MKNKKEATNKKKEVPKEKEERETNLLVHKRKGTEMREMGTSEKRRR
jgi:hypothetical protein